MSRIFLRQMNPTKIAWIALGAVVAMVIALAASVAIGAFIAQKELRAAVPVVSQLQGDFGSDDRQALAASVEKLQKHASAARGAADTPMWWIAEQAPFIGPTLHAVRASTVAVDELAQGVLPALSDVDPALLRPAGGVFDLDALSTLAGPVSTAAAAGEKAADALADVDVQRTPGVLQAPLSQLAGAVTALQPALSRADALVPYLPSMMGQDAPKNYLLLVQNNAEARGLGGIPASVVMLRFAGGKMEIAQQAASGDFTNNRATPIVPLDPEVVKLYDDKIGRWSQDVTSTPDFTLSAELAKAYWTETFATPVDGVISIDPVVLSYILRATGPITLATGDELTSSDAVKVLLSDVYAKYPKNAAQDAFFAAAAVEVFDAVSSGDFEPVPFAAAIVQAVDENRVYFSSFDEGVESALAGSRLLGPLPASDDADRTTLSVFVNDLTEAKLSYYTWMSADVVVDRCSSVPRYTMTVTFVNAIDKATSDSLVSYINPALNYPKGVLGTDLQFYGPSGATFVGATFDGVDVSVTNGEHLGRPVGRLWAVNGPQDAHTMTVTFEGSPDDSAEVSLVHTPMVNPVRTSVSEVACG
ncbi:hypothetical protein QE412_001918 [Microbacterium trichothecenolyticum]|uniref:DUF4012 domain-containing protein n=2 Tax=Microbacterium trichothecenolyticum TaxID=69370 RepID=A0ABU0TV18_MICTR|nr:hypothetical protein [Microbacterium trichothecenolyticum]